MARINYETDAQALSRLRGLAVIQSTDHGSAIAAGMALARNLVTRDNWSADVVLATPEADRWTLPELNDQVINQHVMVPLGDQRVVLVDSGDNMDPRSFDHLLKTVEEPAANVLFLFITTRAENLPATMLGRALRIITAAARTIGEVAEDAAKAMGAEPDGRVLEATLPYPLLAGALSGAHARETHDALQEVLTIRASGAAGAFHLAQAIKAAGRAASGQGPSAPSTKAAVRETARMWMGALQGRSIDPRGGAVDMHLYDRIERGREMLARHLPLEHVLGYILVGQDG